MKYKLKVYSIWEYGKRVDEGGNPHQEDSIFPSYGQQNETDRLFVLCDGMGGHEAGEVASSVVCREISKSIFDSSPDPEGDFSDDMLKKAISEAFDALDAIPTGNVSNDKKMGTTMTLLKLHNKGCTIAHIGDSRVYHIRPGADRENTTILFQTKDHSLVEDLIKIGELTREEAKYSKQKNVITRAMQPQMDRRPRPDINHISDIRKGDYFFLCSDGMLEQMEDDNLRFNFSDMTGDDENKVGILTKATSQNRDNHSAIIVHILDVIDAAPAEEIPGNLPDEEPSPFMAEIEDDSLADDMENKVEGGKSEIKDEKEDEKEELHSEEEKNEQKTSDISVSEHFSEKINECFRYRQRKGYMKIIISFVIVIVLLVGLICLYPLIFTSDTSEQEKIEMDKKVINTNHITDNITYKDNNQDLVSAK